MLMDSISIGLAGPRGAGKSTIIHYLCTSLGSLFVRRQADSIPYQRDEYVDNRYTDSARQQDRENVVYSVIVNAPVRIYGA
jgi:ABC-type multidrug transport system ATPase subunit